MTIKTQILTMLFAAFLLSSCKMIDLGSISKIAKLVEGAGEMSERDEIELGQQMAAVILGAGKLYDNKEAQDYVNNVGRWLANNSKRPHLGWSFAVIDSDDINAFAAPGGYIIISSGLLNALNNEAELAAVLAHEIIHVSEKHHVKEAQRAGKVNLLGNLALMAADRKAEEKGDEGYWRNRQIGQKVLSASHDLYTKGLGRDDELQADKKAVFLLARAGYDAWSLYAVLQILQSINPEDSQLALLMATHPKTEDRIAALTPVLENMAGQGASGLMLSQRYISVLRQVP